MDRKEKIKIFFFRKRVMIPVVLLLFVGSYFLFRPDPKLAKITVQKVQRDDLRQTILATGQIISQVDLDLSFNSNGIVRDILVKVGDKVKKGQVLARLDSGQSGASLTSARGGLASAQAQLRKILEGASNEEVNLAQVTLDQTKKTQDNLVASAYQNMLNSTLEAVPENGTNDYVAPTISGSYTGKEGAIKINTYYSTNGISFSASGLVTGSAAGNLITSQSIGNSGLFIKFPSLTSVNDWVINIPNKKASNYLSNYNAYQQALAQRDLAVGQAQAQLDIKKAQARHSDVQLAEAAVTVALGQYQQALSKYQDTILVTPSDGTITSIDIKLGELSEIQKKIMTLQDVSNLYVQAKINESNIANLKNGQEASFNLDAFGPDQSFKGIVAQIDPSSDNDSGIVNYKIEISIDEKDNPNLRSGMNANISILTNKKNQVIVVPKASLVEKDGKFYANLITNSKKKKYIEKEIKIGLVGDGNMVEITDGLSIDDEIALISK